MKPISITIGLLLLSTINAFSQSDFSFEVLEHTPYSDARNQYFVGALKINDDFSVAVVNIFKGTLFDYQLLQIISNTDHKVVRSTPFRKFRISQSMIIANQLYLFGRSEETDFRVCIIDPMTSKCKQEIKLLDAPIIKKAFKHTYQIPTVVISEDRSKLGVLQKVYDPETKHTEYHVAVFDSKLELIKTDKIDGASKSFYLKIYDAIISNEGEVFASFLLNSELNITRDNIFGPNNYISSANKEKTRSAGFMEMSITDGTLNYYEISRQSKGAGPLELKQIFLDNALKENSSNTIIIKDKHDGYIPVVRVFEKLPNGNLLIVGEETSTPINGVIAYRDIHIDIIDKEGSNIHSTTIPKEQICEPRYGSFTSMLIGDRLYMVYSDTGNKKYANLIVQKYNLVTGELSKEKIFANKDFDFTPYPVDAYPVDDSSMLIYTSDMAKRILLSLN